MAAPYYGVCLACGSPPIPFGEDGIFSNKVGNLSILSINRMCSKNDNMLSKCDNPRFCPKYDEKEQSHMVHRSHHRWAVEFMTKHRDDHNMINDPFVGIHGGFPYELNPSTNHKSSMIAIWNKPSQDQRVRHTKLYEFISAVPERPFPIDYNLTFALCKTCNDTMTQRFFFKFHLYDGTDKNTSNASRLIDREAITVFEADTRGNDNLTDWDKWLRTFPFKYKQPQDVYDERKDILAPAVAYYLHCSLPFDLGATPTFYRNEGQKGLYMYLSWYILEITCLMSEYYRGSGNSYKTAKGKRYRQSVKFYLGPLELYLSYFYWMLLLWKYPILEGKVGFEVWHRYYFSDASNCKKLFPDQAEQALMTFHITPGDPQGLSSKDLIEKVSDNIMELFTTKILKLGMLLVGKNLTIGIFFPPVRYIQELKEIESKGMMRDFDSFVEHIGIDCMLKRTLDLGRDLDEPVVDKLKSFRLTWIGFEIDNVAANNGFDKRQATIYYNLCKLLKIPDKAPDTWEQYLKLMEGPRCSPWACAIALNRLGAFRQVVLP
jgi:hypothetical protein